MQSVDVFFLNGRPIEQVRETIAAVKSYPRHQPQPLRFALSAFVIARSTDAEAQEVFQQLSVYASQDDRSQLMKGVDTNVAMFKQMAEYPGIGTNGGAAAGLVGSYDTVAQRIADFTIAGIKTFMLQFQPITPELERFAAEIIPRVRSLKPVA